MATGIDITLLQVLFSRPDETEELTIKFVSLINLRGPNLNDINVVDVSGIRPKIIGGK